MGEGIGVWGGFHGNGGERTMVVLNALNELEILSGKKHGSVEHYSRQRRLWNHRDGCGRGACFRMSESLDTTLSAAFVR